MHYFYTIRPNDKFSNVRDVLKSHFLVSTRLLNKLKKSNLIFINNIPVTLDSPVLPGDKVSFSMDFDEDSSNIIPVKMNLNIVYEDESFLIINKPANLAVHPTSYHFTDTLSNGVKYYFDGINLHKKIRILHKKIRIVNRLDRNTSGLIIIAKNEYVQEFLIRQMKTNNFIKKYIGIVEGTLESTSSETFNSSPNNFLDNHSNLLVDTIKNPIEATSSNKMNKNIDIKKSGTINAPIARKPNSIIERCVSRLRRRGNH